MLHCDFVQECLIARADACHYTTIRVFDLCALRRHGPMDPVCVLAERQTFRFDAVEL